MKRVLLLAAITTLAISNLRAQLPPAYTTRLQTVLDSMCNLYHVKGASAAIELRGKGKWQGVHGESHAGNPITPNMLFGLGSNTKTYIAALMLRLQEQGALTLNDTIGKWIHNRSNISGRITIRQLLNHTSGIFSYTDTTRFYDSVTADFTRIWTPGEMLQFIGKPLFAPGTSWSYSNTNYLLAGMIASQVTGKPVQQALRDLILTPGGFNDTWFFPQEHPGSGTMPHVWFFDNDLLVDGNVAYGYQHESFLSAANAAGALIATAEDNAAFWQKMINGQLLNAASMAEWKQTVRLSGSVGYGLGVFRYNNINGRTIYEHGGTGLGFINENLADSAAGIAISVLTNQDSADNDQVLDIVAALHRVMLNPPTTGLVALAPASNFELYPNPASTKLQCTMPGYQTQRIAYQIIDVAGRVLKTGVLTGSPETIDITGLTNGNYIFRIQTMAKQFVIAH